MSPANVEITSWLTQLRKVRVENGEEVTIEGVKPPLTVSVDRDGRRATARCRASFPETIVDSSADYKGVSFDKVTLTVDGVRYKGARVTLSLL